MDVQKIMTTNVTSVKSGDSLALAARAMWDCDCGAVPVIDPANEELVGIVTDRDICIATWSRDLPPSAIRVSEAMTHQVVSCLGTDTIAAVENLMRAKQIRRIPVVDRNHHLIGIVSLADIAVSAHRDAALDTTPSRDVAAVLARISTPRAAQAAGGPLS